jgi:hypothetical protein
MESKSVSPILGQRRYIPSLEEILPSVADYDSLNPLDREKLQKSLEERFDFSAAIKGIKLSISSPRDLWQKVRHGRVIDDFETWQKITCMELHVPKGGKIEASLTTTKEHNTSISIMLVGGGGGGGLSINATMKDIFSERTTSLRLFSMIKVRITAYEDGYVRTNVLEAGRIGQEDLGETFRSIKEAVEIPTSKPNIGQSVDLYSDPNNRTISEEVANTTQLSIQAKTKAPKLNSDIGFSFVGKITTSTSIKIVFPGKNIPKKKRILVKEEY